MRTDTDIANMACDFLTLDPIGNLATDQGPGKYLRRNYEEAIGTVLREFSWNCATVRALAVRVSTDDEVWRNFTTYDSLYVLPSDYMRMIDINDRPLQEIFWTVESVAITDEDGVVLSYRKVLRVQADFWAVYRQE